MSPSAHEGEPFQLGFSKVIAENLKKLQRQASREGRGEKFLDALRSIVKRLQTDPNEFGEPLYPLPILRLQVQCTAVRPIYVDFAVSEDQPLVFIKAVKLLP